MANNIDKVPSLSFGDDVAPCGSASTTAGQVVELAAEQPAATCSEPDDPDADLEAMSDDALYRLVTELRASRDQRIDRLLRRLKANAILQDRENTTTCRKVRSDQGSTLESTTAQRAARGPRRVRLVTVLGQVTEQGGPKQVEDLARWLANDLSDLGSIRTYRAIADGVRSGRVDPQVVRAAYRAAKKPGVERPGALFTWFVLGRSAGLARERARRR